MGEVLGNSSVVNVPAPKLAPLPVRQILAKNPTRKPTFSVPVKILNGTTLQVQDPTATRAMIALMDMEAAICGAASHFGGPSAFAEINSALFGIVFHRAELAKMEWFDLFHLVNDAGHCENGIYALKASYGFADLTLQELKGFRSIESRLTGHGESHLFPEGVYLSNGPLGSSLAQSQGLAFAECLSQESLADTCRKVPRVTITTISDGACMEGETREALAAIPGLAAMGKMAPYVLIISDNNTKLSGRIDEESFSMAPTFASLDKLGWKVLSLAEGHNLQKCVETIESAIDLAQGNPTQPVAIHVRTVKGFGTQKTSQSSSGAHGFPLKDPSELPSFLSEIYGTKEIPKEFSAWIEDLHLRLRDLKSKSASPNAPSSMPFLKVKREKVQEGIARAMIKARSQGLPVFSLSCDLAGSTGVAAFQKTFPDSTWDVGVAESNMVGMAAGLSKQGFIPVVDTFSQFGVTKGALPFIMANLSQAPMIAVFSHVGFQDAADGASHQALSYFAMTHALPYTDTYALTSSSEAEALMLKTMENFAEDRRAGKTPRTTIFFLGRENFPQSYMESSAKYELGKSQVVWKAANSSGKSVTILAAGALLEQALLAAEILQSSKIEATVVNASAINRPDVETLLPLIEASQGRLLTVEDHQKVGGMGQVAIQSLIEALTKKKSSLVLKAKSLGVDDEFGQSSYTALELYQKHGIDASAIVKAAQEL